jgi:membrane-bound lytic murein transglycosylase A
MRSRLTLVISVALALSLVLGVGVWLWLKPKPIPHLALRATTYDDVEGWPGKFTAPSLGAFQRSCVLILKMDDGAAMGGYGGHAKDWKPVCAVALKTKPADARHFFESQFKPFEIFEDGSREGLFTGYYEPLLRGSRTRHGAYQTPVYGVPADLVSVDLGLFDPKWKGERVSGRAVDGKLALYPTRAEIDTHPPSDTKVLFYGGDAVDVFFLHIQGSGRVKLDDGSMIRIAYAAQNGRPYTPIGRTLIHMGALQRGGVSMQTIRAWLKNNPAKAQGVLESDQSFVFFKEQPLDDPTLGATGSEGVALTPMGSIAVDTRLHPLGAPFFVSAGRGVFIAQDVGGAIRGAVRADIYFGFGPDAEKAAGGMQATGTLTVLLPATLYNHGAP